jgi:hypothetical protein
MRRTVVFIVLLVTAFVAAGVGSGHSGLRGIRPQYLAQRWSNEEMSKYSR